MVKNTSKQKKIYVYADWLEMKEPELVGVILVSQVRAKEVISFEYAPTWLKSKFVYNLDPNLTLFTGHQYPNSKKSNFGIFLDSSPDRWGRVLMRKREEQLAREEGRPAKNLLASDYLLGVFDKHRMGALRFKLDPQGEFLDSNEDLATPPWLDLRELEYASLQIENDKSIKNKNYKKWLNCLIAPGSSLGGARPKASVIDEKRNLWIAKFPSIHDGLDIGAWEFLVYQLAVKAGIQVAESRLKQFGTKHHTFLTKRFDRLKLKRIHFASAMTVLDRLDGDAAEQGASYLEMVDFLIQQGSKPTEDLEQLWRRIVFNVCVSNTDDHLRNHGFLLVDHGWSLSPAYDMNPSETGDGLTLNISRDDNSQDLDLVLDVAEYFRLKKTAAKKIIKEVITAVKEWRMLAKKRFSNNEIQRMEQAFRIADS